MQIAITLGLSSTTAVYLLGSAPVGSVLGLAPVYLQGASPMAYSAQWQRDGSDISGATSASYTTVGADIGHVITALITFPDTSVINTTNSVTVTAGSGVAPSEPTNLLVSRGNARNDLTWEAPTEDGGVAITGYLLEVNIAGAGWNTLATLGVVLLYAHTGLTNGTLYDYRVSAINPIGTGLPSLTYSGTPATYPGAPTSLGVTHGDTTNALAWTAPASDGGSAITDYQIEVSIDGGSWAIITDGVSTSTSYSHTGLINGSSYNYRVSTVTAIGVGAASTPAAGTPATTPGQVLSLAVSEGDASNSLTWAPPASNGGSAITGYLLEVNIAAGGWNTLTTLGVILYYDHLSLTNGTNYVYRVTAINAEGNSSTASATANGTPAAAGAGAITLTELPRDRFIFDSGLGRGLNSATINLSGTGTDGVVVQARAVQATPSVYGLGYRDIPTFAGCLTPPTLVVGVDTLPAGVNYNAGTKTLSSTVDLPGASPVMTGWSATNVQVAIAVGKAPILFEDCEFTFDASSTVSGLWTLTSIPSGAYTPGLKNCTVICPARVDLTFVKCLRPQNGAIMGAPITGSYFVGMPSDFAYLPSPPAGETMRFADNIIEYTTNYPVGTTTYSAGTTYNTGDYMKYTDGFYYKALVNGLIGVGPTVTNGTDANWTQSDVHADVWYLSGGGAGTVLIENNLTIWPNDVRLGRPNNLMFRYKESEMAGIDFGQYVIRNNQLNQHSGVSAFCAQVIANGGGGTRYGNIYCYGNRIVKGSGSQVFYPTGWPAWCFFSDNRSVNLVTTYAVPANASAYTGTAPGDPVQWASAWTDIDTIASGVYAGSITVPRKRFWMTAEVRIKTDTAVTDSTSNTFGAGTLIDLYDQSVWAHAFDASFSGTTPAPVRDADAVQVYLVNRTTHAASRISITDTTFNSAATVAYANVLMAHFPGEKFGIGTHLLSGTSPIEMINDSILTRLWSDEVLLHDLTTGNGITQVGIVFNTGWIAYNSAPDNDDQVLPIFLGKTVAGVSKILDDTISGSFGTYTLSHMLPEIYDFTYTMFGYSGPDGREMSSTQVGWNDSLDIAYHGLVDSWAATMADTAHFPEAYPLMLSNIGGVRGYASGATWTDQGHPSAVDDDGLVQLAKTGAENQLRTMGATNWPLTGFTNADYVAGSHADFWIDGFNITTERNRRGGASSYVRGWTKNGAAFPLTTQVQLVANAGGSGYDGVRITDATIDYTTAFEYGQGRRPGCQDVPADFFASYWLDLPVVNTGQRGTVTMPVAMRSAQALGNNIAPPANFTVAGATYWRDTVNIGTSPVVTSMRFEITGAFDLGASTVIAMDAQTSNFQVQILSNGQIRLYVSSTLVSNGILSVVDLVSNTITVVIEKSGADLLWTLTTNSGSHNGTKTGASFVTTVKFSLLAKNDGTSKCSGTFTSMKIWKNDLTGAGAAYHTVAGSAATVNGDAWFLGSPAT